MAINRVSRYFYGPIQQVEDPLNPGTYNISVYRSWPESITASYKDYIWKDGDTLSGLAFNSPWINAAQYWWQIMDLNPEITDPFSIEPGTVIRIPHGNH